MRIYINSTNGNGLCIARREGKYRLSKLDIGIVEDFSGVDKIAYGDGYYVQEDALFVGKRTIEIGFTNYAGTTDEFMRALNPKYMVDAIFEECNIRQTIRGKVQCTPTIARDRTRQVNFSLICYNPFFATERLHRSLFGTEIIKNNGDVECSVKLRILGTTKKGIDLVISNESSGYCLSFEGMNLAEGDILEADSSLDKHTITIIRSDGTTENGYNYLSHLENCRLFDLLPGENIISCQYNDTDYSVDIEYSEQYLDWGVVI